MRDAMAALHFDEKIEIQDKQRADGRIEREGEGGVVACGAEIIVIMMRKTKTTTTLICFGQHGMHARAFFHPKDARRARRHSQRVATNHGPTSDSTMRLRVSLKHEAPSDAM